MQRVMARSGEGKTELARAVVDAFGVGGHISGARRIDLKAVLREVVGKAI